MQGNFKRNLLISSAISIVILLVSSTASYLSIRNLLQSTDLVNHTQEVIYNLNRGTTVMVEAQTSMRGFLINGREELLSRYNNSESLSDSYFEKVNRLTLDNPQQQQNLKELKPLKEQFFKYLKKRIQDKRNNELTTASSLNTGTNLMDSMRKVLDRMEREEQRLLSERSEESKNYATYSLILIITAALIALLISIVFFMRILGDYRERQKLFLELENKDIETANRIAAISEIAAQISKGDFQIRTDDTQSDALGSVADSLNSMAVSLDESFTNLSEKEWHQTGIAELNNVMIGEKSMALLTGDIIEFLSYYTNTNASALYTAENQTLHLCAAFSYAPDEKRKHIPFGDGISGQAAVSGKMMELKSFSPEDIVISYAMGQLKPAHVVALPLIDGNVVGVIELASVQPYSKRDLDFLNNATTNIAIAIKSSLNRERIQELLEETQAQSEELRVQHTELESMNAELEVQTEKLQASEEELRVQQEELQQTNEELAERSVLLEERNMEIQKKSEDLELSTRYKSEFLANMSHELRTPLNSILLLSRLLSENNEQNLSEEQTEFARVIQSSGKGLLSLIDEILDLSKIEAGKMDLEFIEVPMEEITESLKGLFAVVAKEKNIEFSIKTENAPLVIRTDKTRLEQILKNLISNAIKFTSKGSVTLEITKEDEEKTVAFNVKDTGIGIAPEKQPLIFEAFQQADGSTKRKYGGTGLGLSISRELAKLLNGEITLKSKIDQGSEFVLRVPIVGTANVVSTKTRAEVVLEMPVEEHKPDPFVSNTIPAEIPDDRKNISEGDKVILIVEDDTNFAKSLLEFTRQRGYKGIVVVRGDHALNMALKFKPAGILLDIQLPVKSGWEVMEELKTNPQTKPVPVHIMSSHNLRQESLLKGAVNFLDKPVTFEQIPEVFKKIESIVNRDSQKVLIIEDNPKHAKALAYFLENHNINSEIKSEITEGITALQNSDVDCVILDMGIPDKQAYDILENVKKNQGMENLPVIVFTGRSLSMQEEIRIKKYADTIVVKTAHSYQRMLDEVSLFLHIVEDKKSARKHDMLNNGLKGKTVLVVDDDVRNIFSLTKSLEALKMQVITATDGKEALKALEDHPKTDIVLLDMMMPNMDGYETAERIRMNKKFKQLPIIAVTAKAMTGDREKCINAGASDYITKPVDADQLLSLLRVWLYDKK